MFVLSFWKYHLIGTWYIVELTILREKFTKWYSGKINNSLFNNQFNPIKQIYLSGTLYSIPGSIGDNHTTTRLFLSCGYKKYDRFSHNLLPYKKTTTRTTLPCLQSSSKNSTGGRPKTQNKPDHETNETSQSHSRQALPRPSLLRN